MHACRKEFFQLGEFGLHQLRRGQGIAAGGQLHAHAHCRFAIEAGRSVIALRAQFHPCHIFQMHHRAIGIGTQHNILKLFYGFKLAGHHNRSRHGLPGTIGQLAQTTGRHLRILGGNSGVDIGGA